jgi:hypothetical protein
VARVELRGELGLRGQVIDVELAADDEGSWARTRAYVLALVLREWFEATEIEARNAATVALIQWAQESGWGEHEYRFNGAGVGCGTGATCMRMSHGDATLRAYATLLMSARDFWAIVRRNTNDAQFNVFLQGDDWAWRPLWQRRIWTPIVPREANALSRAVRTRIANGRADVARLLPPSHAFTAGDTYAGPVSDPARVGDEVSTRRARRGRSKGGFGLLAVAAAAAAFST